MIKKILIILAMLLLMAYLGIAVTTLNARSAAMTCTDVGLIVKDSVNAGFITRKEVETILKKQNIFPVGQPMQNVDLQAIEEVLRNHPLIDQVECFKSPGGTVFAEVSQRIPVLRVITKKGENYYIDNKGAVLPSDTRCVAHLPVVTGNVEKPFVLNNLYPFALFLQKNKFWDAQIEQINVVSGNEIELVPRVGDHIIYLGKLDGYEQKLSRLKEFYRKGLNTVGWNKYERINVEFSNQIICVKKKDK